jgi:muramoyltetrapeptide carboxypeptidase LdcA involved in peptidoglycan recycling
MQTIIPEKLKTGDEVRVIAPARSLAIISPELREIARRRFEELGLVVSFGKHVEEIDDFNSSSIESRISDLHEAFLDPNVKAILPVIGGFNSNQLLPYIDWSIIKNNPKIVCGFSDITALSNTIFAKTGLVTYSGPHYSSFGMEEYFGYSLEYFKKCMFAKDAYDLEPSNVWLDDEWYLNQNNRTPNQNDGWIEISSGEARGKIIGGNLCTLNLLQGTEFMPDLEGTVLFLEDDYESNAVTFDRDLTSLIQQPGFSGVRGIIIGRFQSSSEVTNDLLVKVIQSKRELGDIPVIANVDFGHTTPIIAFPIGGEVSLSVGDNSRIIIEKH